MAFTIHDQWSAIRAEIHREDGSIFEIGGEDGRAKSSDITQGSINKDIGSPCGGFMLGCQPLQNYIDNIKADDWIEIFLDNGDGKGERSVMLGLVDRVARTRAIMPNGAEKENVQIVGRDWGKVLLGTHLVFDPVLGAGMSQAKLTKAYATYTRATPEARVAAPPDKVLGFFLDQLLSNRTQYLGPKGNPVGVDLVRDFNPSADSGNLFFLASLNLNGVLWNLLETYAVGVLNELFTDWQDGKPKLTLREYPYDRGSFAGLDAIPLPSSFVSKEDIGRGDHDVYNWFRLHVDWCGRVETGIASGLKLGYVGMDSIKRHGLRRFEHTTNGLFPQGGSNIPRVSAPETLIENAIRKVASWYSMNDDLLSGSMTCGLYPDAKVGRRVAYVNERSGDRFDFYLEAINHQFNYAEKAGSLSTLRLTRGVHSDDGYATLRSFDDLLSAGALTSVKDAGLWADLYSSAGWTPPTFG